MGKGLAATRCYALHPSAGEAWGTIFVALALERMQLCVPLTHWITHETKGSQL
jgi:hypothetical protein